MARTLTTFGTRRLRNLTATALAVAVLLPFVKAYEDSLRNPAFATGWLLLVASLLLVAYAARKQLRSLPLRPNSAWLQWHAYLGAAATALFFVHAGFDLPDGVLDTALWLSSMGLLASGAFGLLASRLIPARMSHVGEGVLFERIPALRARVAREVEALAKDSVAQTRSSVLAEAYVDHLEPFLARSHVLVHWLSLDRPQRRRMRALHRLRQQLDSDGYEILSAIEARVAAKNNLDYQYSMLLLLKGWQFVHAPLAYSTLLLVAVHMLAVHAFSSGAP